MSFNFQRAGYGELWEPAESPAQTYARLLKEERDWIRERVRTEFRIPPELEEVAISIWLDGKYD